MFVSRCFLDAGDHCRFDRLGCDAVRNTDIREDSRGFLVGQESLARRRGGLTRNCHAAHHEGTGQAAKGQFDQLRNVRGNPPAVRNGWNSYGRRASVRRQIPQCPFSLQSAVPASGSSSVMPVRPVSSANAGCRATNLPRRCGIRRIDYWAVQGQLSVSHQGRHAMPSRNHEESAIAPKRRVRRTASWRQSETGMHGDHCRYTELGSRCPKCFKPLRNIHHRSPNPHDSNAKLYCAVS